MDFAPKKFNRISSQMYGHNMTCSAKYPDCITCKIPITLVDSIESSTISSKSEIKSIKSMKTEKSNRRLDETFKNMLLSKLAVVRNFSYSIFHHKFKPDQIQIYQKPSIETTKTTTEAGTEDCCNGETTDICAESPTLSSKKIGDDCRNKSLRPCAEMVYSQPSSAFTTRSERCKTCCKRATDEFTTSVGTSCPGVHSKSQGHTPTTSPSCNKSAHSKISRASKKSENCSPTAPNVSRKSCAPSDNKSVVSAVTSKTSLGGKCFQKEEVGTQITSEPSEEIFASSVHQLHKNPNFQTDASLASSKVRPFPKINCVKPNNKTKMMSKVRVSITKKPKKPVARTSHQSTIASESKCRAVVCAR